MFSSKCRNRPHWARPGGEADGGSPGSAGRGRKRWQLASAFWALAQLSTQAFQNCVNRGLGGNAEMLEKVLGRAAFAEAVHADEDAVMADHGVPAPADRCLDRDLDGGVADHGLLPVFRL